MIGTAEQDAFIREHLYSVVTTLRRDGSPSNSVIFTVADGDAKSVDFEYTPPPRK